MRLRHYRSIAACEVTLRRLTMLVGPNGSGKSNFLDALRLTAQSLNENLDNALRERGGIGEVRRRSRGHPTHFGVRIDFSISGGADDCTGNYAFQVAAVGGGDYKVSREACFVSSRSLDMESFEVRDGRLVNSSQGIMPQAVPDRLYLVAASGIDAFRSVFDGLSTINVYNVNPDAMRHLQKPEPGDLLRRDGSNVASVIERLRREQPDSKARIEQYLSGVVDGISGVDRRALGAWEAIEFRQRIAGDPKPWTFQGTSMSDGTLRALGVLVALFGSTATLTSPVGVEEPEAALHPAAAGLLLDALRDASDTRQVLVTTHSPDLLDSQKIRAAELLAVRASNGVTTVAPVDEAGYKAINDSLFTPGELLRVDQLTPDHDLPQQSELFRE